MPVIQQLLDDLKAIADLHRRKNGDYANNSNPFDNFDCSEYMLRRFSNPRDQAFVWPIATKLARLGNLLSREEPPNNESIGDSLLDIATYCLLWKADIGERIKTLPLGLAVKEEICEGCKGIINPSWPLYVKNEKLFCSLSCANQITSQPNQQNPEQVDS